MFITLQLVFISLFSSALPSGVDRVSVCESENPKEQIVAIHSLNALYGQMEKLTSIERENQLDPLISADLRQKLKASRANFNERVDASEKKKRIYLKIPPEQRPLYNRVMNSYFYSYERETRALAEVLAHYDGDQRYKKQDQLTDELKGELLGLYESELKSVLSKVATLTAEERKFLIKWSLLLYPEEPAYVGGPAAEYFQTYMWWLKSKNENFPNSGRFPRGIYRLETITNTENPGLRLIATYRSAVNPGLDANLEIIFSPYLSELQVKLCTFEDNRNYCDVETIEAWCAREN